jgi:hypothetical protein
MILTHNQLVAWLRQLDEARRMAVEGSPGWCTQPYAPDEKRDGMHGRAHLGIDSDTGEVVCTWCKK